MFTLNNSSKSYGITSKYQVINILFLCWYPYTKPEHRKNASIPGWILNFQWKNPWNSPGESSEFNWNWWKDDWYPKGIQKVDDCQGERKTTCCMFCLSKALMHSVWVKSKPTDHLKFQIRPNPAQRKNTNGTDRVNLKSVFHRWFNHFDKHYISKHNNLLNIQFCSVFQDELSKYYLMMTHQCKSQSHELNGISRKTKSHIIIYNTYRIWSLWEGLGLVSPDSLKCFWAWLSLLLLE